MGAGRTIFRGKFGQLLVSERLARCLPCAAAFLQDPKARNVFQEANRPSDAHFIGEPGLARRFGNHRPGKFRAEQRPGARTEVGPITPGGGYGGNRVASIVRTTGDHLGRRQ